MSTDTPDPKKPTETKKSMGAPSASSSSQPTSSDGANFEKLIEKMEAIRVLLDKGEETDTEVKKAVKETAQITKKDSKKKDTPEKKLEAQKRMAKMFKTLGDRFEKSFKGLKGLGKWLKGGLGPLKAFWKSVKKVKEFILAFLAVFLLKNFTIKDVKEMWKGMKEFFLETKKLFIKILEFMSPIVKWFLHSFVPETFKLFMATLDNLALSFENLTADFRNFTKKGFAGKFLSIISALQTIGTFVSTFFGDVVNWTFRLLGYDGSITKDLRNWLAKTFSPDLMGKFKAVFTTILGAMAVARIFGMSPLRFMTLASNMIWSAIKATFAVVRLALSPIGLGLTLTALTITFEKEIVRGIENTVGRLITGFKNMFIDLNNAIASTAFGKFLGFKEKAPLEWDSKTKAKEMEAEKKSEIAVFEAEIAKMKEIKEKSTSQSGVAELQQKYGKDVKLWKKTKEGWLWDTVDDREALMTKKQLQLANRKKALQDFQHHWGEELGVDVESPYVGKGTTIGDAIDWTKDKAGVAVKALGIDTIESERRGNFPSEVSLQSTAPDMTSLFEGYGKAGRPGFAYDDGEGNRTIGIGFNMDKDNAEKIMKAAGITKDWNDLRAGKIALTKAEMHRLKDYEEKYFRDSAKNWIGADKWNKMNLGAQNALYDMAQNMGGNFTGKDEKGRFLWKNLRTALRSGNMAGVGPAIRDSAGGYIDQVQKERSAHNIAMLSNAYAVPSYVGDLVPTDKRRAQQDSMMTQHNTVVSNEGDSYIAGVDRARSGNPNLLKTVEQGQGFDIT